MKDKRMTGALVVILVMIQTALPFLIWSAARQSAYGETRLLLGAVAAQDLSAASRGVHQYLAAEDERGQYEALAHRALQQAGYANTAERYITGRLLAGMPLLLTTLLLNGAALTGAALYCSRRERKSLALVNSIREEAEVEKKHMAAAREGLLREIDHYEENLYHQLKTPLTSLRLCLEQLRQDTAPSCPVYETAEAQVEKLTHLVTLFLRDKRLSANQIKFHYRLAALDTIVDDAVAQLRHQAAFRRIRVDWALPEGEFFLRCDETWLTECVITLLENAVTHSPEHGLVRLILCHEPRRYRLQIQSSGGRLPADKPERVFDRYYSGRPGHFGIGLHMARTIAENHHGRIEAYNIEMDGSGQGVSFELVLPILDRAETYNVTTL